MAFLAHISFVLCCGCLNWPYDKFVYLVCARTVTFMPAMKMLSWCAQMVKRIEIACANLSVLQILSFGGDDVFKLNLALYNNATEGQKYLDMHAFDVEVSLRTGRMKVVFLNKFVQNVLVCSAQRDCRCVLVGSCLLTVIPVVSLLHF